MKTWLKGGLIGGIIFLILLPIVFMLNPKPYHVDNEFIALPLFIILGIIIGIIIGKIKSKK